MATRLISGKYAITVFGGRARKTLCMRSVLIHLWILSCSFVFCLIHFPLAVVQTLEQTEWQDAMSPWGYL
ncbi:hypothetical protein, partial [Klebsiella variicola]|uniref:hypothetical protein n=1 Tax=Klebsiella variicola TaxID=244366 RepID=UPI0019548452